MKLLLIDDQVFVRDALEELLKHLGHEVYTAQNGVEGLDQLRRNPDIQKIFTDYRMPVMNGIEFAAQAHSLRPELPIIMISSNLNTAQVAEAVKAGVSGFLHKPFEIKQIEALAAA